MEQNKTTIGHMLIAVWAVLIKNFKTMFRSGSSIFIIMIAPLLVISFLILAFNNNSLYDINLGVYSSSYSSLSDKIINNLEGKDYVITKSNSSEECFNGVKNTEFNACLVFSPDMQVTNEADNKIEFYVDPARINIVNSITSSINKEILQTSANLSLDLTNVLLDQLQKTKDELNAKMDLLSMMKDNNKKITDNANSIKSTADSIDIVVTYDSFAVSDLRKELSRINSSSNMSSSDFQSFTSKITVIDTQINSTISKLSAAKTKINDLSTGLSGIPTIADSSTRQVDNYKGSVDQIISNINGIQVTNPENIVSPIKTIIQPIEPQTTYIGKFLPTFLLLIIMFVCVMLASSLVLSERMSGAYIRNVITATPKSVFLMGAYLTSLIIIMFHIISISILLNLLIGFNIELMLGAALPLFLICTMFIFIGIVIGYISASQESSSVISLLVITASIFFSNTILPLETIPMRLKDILLYNPFVVSEALLRKVIIFDFTLDKVLDHIVRILWYSFVLIALSYIGLKFSKHGIKK